MNRFHILTLFPEMVMDGLNTSIIGRAIEAGLLEINAVNIRDYSTNKHMKVDDYPYGGGAGLVVGLGGSAGQAAGQGSCGQDTGDECGQFLFHLSFLLFF